MDALCGVWSLDGALSSRRLESVRAAMLEAAGGKAGSFEEAASGPLWMAAGKGKFARGASSFAAVEGSLPPGPGSDPADLLARIERDPSMVPSRAGHYVLAFARPAQGELSFYRDPWGSERIFFIRTEDLLLFASSIEPLFAVPGVRRAADPDTALEHGVLGVVLFGDSTPFLGVRQVLPGHRLEISGGEPRQCCLMEERFFPLEGDVPGLGRRLWRSLLEDVAESLGTDREAAVSLSGGIDSAGVAAALAEVLGPERVHAFTYEYADAPTSEVGLARLVCRRLGIRRHSIRRFERGEILDAIPEAMRMNGLINFWHTNGVELAMTRFIASHGFRRYFCGCGPGGYLPFLQEVGEAFLERPRAMGLFWSSIFRHHRPRAASRWLPPCLNAAAWGASALCYLQMLVILRGEGLVEELSRVFRGRLGELVESLCSRPRVKGALAATRNLPLPARLLLHHYASMNNFDDRGRRAGIARLGGASKIVPFALPGSWGLTFLPLAPAARAPWRDVLRLRPANALQREAYGDRIPSEVVFRRKNYREGAPPDSWIFSAMREFELRFAPLLPRVRELWGLRPEDSDPGLGSLGPGLLWYALLIDRSLPPARQDRHASSRTT